MEGWRYGYNEGPLLMICENDGCPVFIVGIATGGDGGRVN